MESTQLSSRVMISDLHFIIFFFIIINLFIFGCVRSSFLCEGSLQLRRAGSTPHRGARASHRRGLSRCGAQAPDTQAQQLWLTGSAAPQHAGSSQTRARTRVPCTGRQTLNHCATREAPHLHFRLTTLMAMWRMDLRRKGLDAWRPNPVSRQLYTVLWDGGNQVLKEVRGKTKQI